VSLSKGSPNENFEGGTYHVHEKKEVGEGTIEQGRMTTSALGGRLPLSREFNQTGSVEKRDKGEGGGAHLRCR